MADRLGFPDCNTCMMIDRRDRLWLFWPTILANSWESCITNFKRAVRYDGPGAPQWGREGLVLLKPDDFRDEALRGLDQTLKELDLQLSDRLKAELDEVRDRLGSKLYQRLGWQPRCKPTVLPSGRILLGKIHWPIVLIQIGVEARGQQRVRHIDFDTLAIDTSASRHVQPGASLRVESDTFGHLYLSGEVPAFSLHARGVEQRPNQEFAGTYTVRDSWDHKVAQGSLDSFQVNYGEEAKQDLKLNVSGFGAFCLDVDLQNRRDPSEHLHMRSWFGVLPGPTPPPCRWAGTGIYAGHGWAQGDLRFLDILTAAGIGVVREEFGWSGVERTKGEYAVSPQAEAFVDGLAERGIRLNLLLTYGNPIHENPLDPDAYSRWAAWMARHFDGRVRDFEIWNEPHNFQFRKHYGGDASGNAPWIGKFVELSLKAGAAIRDVRPDANIIICSEDV